MKANEAPERIYLFENPVSNEPDDRWLSKRSDDNDIEYTRTDAFIEKACEYFRRGLEDTKVIDDYRNILYEASKQAIRQWKSLLRILKIYGRRVRHEIHYI